MFTTTYKAVAIHHYDHKEEVKYLVKYRNDHLNTSMVCKETAKNTRCAKGMITRIINEKGTKGRSVVKAY